MKVKAGGTVQHTAEGHGAKEPTFHDYLEFVIGGEVTERDDEQITLEASISHETYQPIPVLLLSQCLCWDAKSPAFSFCHPQQDTNLVASTARSHRGFIAPYIISQIRFRVYEPHVCKVEEK